MEFLVVILSIFGVVAMLAHLIISGTINHYRQYRKAFERRVSLGLRESFIRYSITQLFILTIALAFISMAIGWYVTGFLGAVAGLLVALVLPFSFMRRLRQRRRLQFTKQLPDGLHALSASLRSGANISRGLEQLAEWQPAPLSQEMGLVIAEHEFGSSLEQSLASLHRRIPTQEVELMITAIVLSKNVGGNISDTLETLALTLTEKLAVEGKVQSLTATGRLQGWVAMAIPVVVGFFLVSMQPEMMEFFLNDFRGYVTLAIVSVMMVAAYFSIQRIVKIDV